jgi:hypothetical protein
MTRFPVIRTAIPLRRYQVGDYAVALLGEIDSGDGVDYRFILAFVEQGQNHPSLYVCSERNPPAAAEDGAFCLRIVNRVMSEVLGVADGWGEIETFAAEGLRIGKQTLGLGNDPEQRLL